MKYCLNTRILVSAIIVYILSAFLASTFAFAQETTPDTLISTTSTSTATTTPVATSTPTTTRSLIPAALQFETADLTKPEETQEKEAILRLIEQRPIEDPGLLTLLAYWVQQAVIIGIPANTIVLILLLPVLATIITFVRSIIGLPSLEMLVPITLAFVFVAIGVTIGLIVLFAIVAASFASRRLLRKAPLMYFPKRSLSLLLLAFFVFAALTVVAGIDIDQVRELSIFPILILTLLGDSIVSVQLHKSMRETVVITVVTLALGLIGYLLATAVVARDLIILYPEVILLTIPANIVMGRYFGLRLSELFRFRNFNSYGSE